MECFPSHEKRRFRSIHLFLAVSLALSPFAASCRQLYGLWSETVLVTVRLPPVHPVISLAASFGRPSYTLLWYDSAGAPCSVSGVRADTEIELSRTAFTPVRLLPEFPPARSTCGVPETGALPAAGALYPADAAEDGGMISLETSWTGGILAQTAAFVFDSAAGGTEDARIIAGHFNWRRLAGSIAAFSNPLETDIPRLAGAILSGSVTAADIRERNGSVVPIIPDPAAGGAGMPEQGTVFLPAWPGAEPLVWPVAGNPSLVLADGLHRFFARTGCLTVQVTDHLAVCAFFRRWSLPD